MDKRYPQARTQNRFKSTTTTTTMATTTTTMDASRRRERRVQRGFSGSGGLP